MTAVTVRVPAKVNLQLAVGPARPDGYHELVTVFHAVALYDEVTVSEAPRPAVTVSGEGAGTVPEGPGNLAVKAAQVLARATGRQAGDGPQAVAQTPDGPPVAIDIKKRIPVAAGLAGGSADAAAALVACNELWQTGLTPPQLAELAAEIGSDVAFALNGGTAVGQGRGERLTPALASGQYHWVLAFAAGGLSTPEVYQTCDRIRAGRGIVAAPPRLSKQLMAALRTGKPAEVGPLLSNELQPAAVSLRPDLRRTLAAGEEHGALGAVVSGSGPTCAFLAADRQRAGDLVVGLTGAGVCRSAVRVTGPAAGAVVLRSG